jgi:hypothetical protein
MNQRRPYDRSVSIARPAAHAAVVTPPVEIPVLARQLRRARRNLATDSPFSPAWTATVEWVDELEGQARSMGLDPDALVEQLPRRRPYGSA